MRAGSETVIRADAADELSASAARAPPASHLHVRIIGASTAFRGDPIDVLCGILDVACLAVDAILGVDLKPRFTTVAFNELVNACRTIALFGSGIYRQIDCRRYVSVLERQMNRLVFLMIGV